METKINNSESNRTVRISNSLTPSSPNVFRTRPRPGGYIKTLISPRSSNVVINEEKETREQLSVNQSRSQLLRGLRALYMDTGPQGNAGAASCSIQCARRLEFTSSDCTSTPRIQSEDDNNIDSSDDVSLSWSEDNREADMNSVLSVVISTAMLLANGKFPCPDDHLLWSSYFLGTIKDDLGKIPPNVAGVLSHINYTRYANSNPKNEESEKNAENGKITPSDEPVVQATNGNNENVAVNKNSISSKPSTESATSKKSEGTASKKSESSPSKRSGSSVSKKSDSISSNKSASKRSTASS